MDMRNDGSGSRRTRNRISGKIKNTRGKDKEVVKVLEKMKKAEVKNLKGDEQNIEEDLVLKERNVYVLKDEELRLEVIWLHYDILVVGHGGRQKMTELVTRNYQWPGVTKDVKRDIDRCNLCQRMKNKTKAPAEKLMINEISEKM